MRERDRKRDVGGGRAECFSKGSECQCLILCVSERERVCVCVCVHGKEKKRALL